MGAARAFKSRPCRRIAAFMIDWSILAAYLGALAAMVLIVARDRAQPPQSLADRVQGQALAFAVATGPLILYFALMEASRWQATVGKRLLGLRVATLGGSRPTMRWTMLRALVKFAPWEICHTAIWHGAGRPFIDPPAALSMVVMVAAQLAALVYVVMLFVGSGRTLYDRASGTHVVLAPRGSLPSY